LNFPLCTLRDYFHRIGYTGDAAPNLATLCALHTAHLQAIPYENLDIHLGRELALDENAIFDKLVNRGRGGWCYEMNGLFAWALRELGFDVRLLGSAVGRADLSAGDEHDHLILRVNLGQPYLADVGFGNGLRQPIPLQAGEYRQGFMRFALRNEGQRWWFVNHAGLGPGFDFTLQERRMSEFAPRCRTLQTAPESGFVRVAVCHRQTAQGCVSLRGLVMKTVTAEGETEGVIATPAEYAITLKDTFGLRLSDAETAALWRLAQARHTAWAKPAP
jgi:N-hydroxyarylamine O-acetyltransferase